MRRHAPAALLLALSALPAAAKPFQASPLTPGYWAFPATNDVDGDALAASCRSGFSIYFADGHALSFVTSDEGEATTIRNDGLSRCDFDATRQAASCTDYSYSDEATTESTSQLVFSTDPDGRLKVEHVPSSGAATTTYPVECPDEAIRSVLSNALAPR